MKYHKIPDETISRLPIYLRELLRLSEKGMRNISSKLLAELLGFNSAQIRKDFSYFGGFGTRGVGYEIDDLIQNIKKILKLNVVCKTALVGVGNLGSAILQYSGFEIYGLDIKAAFDIAPYRLGKVINGIKIESISKLAELKRRKIEIAILSVPRNAAQETADILVNAGVSGILNLTPARLVVPQNVKVITLDIAMYLARLPYYMSGKIKMI